MIYGTKLLESDIELFTAALTQSNVYVWSLDQHGVYFQVECGIVERYTPDHVKVRSSTDSKKSLLYPRETCEFSIQF
ncbi:hypothetical protein J2Z66_006934 [Paenibacillus eucommiae]|uniref:Uncharacterized protein n=1 Tax=Paenibacillus eucommiae TaxID=1355755 RepID=A0ABS4J636_9BACL|nr:hypothetical protein [Paenibacillus eucommiae]